MSATDEQVARWRARVDDGEPIAFTFYEVAALAHGAWDAEYVNWVLWERTCFPMDGEMAMRQMHAYLIDPAAGEDAFADYEERMLAGAAAGGET